MIDLSNKPLVPSRRYYSGECLESGGTSIAGDASPDVKKLLSSGVIRKGMKVLDYGAGKFARNSNYLREAGVEVFSYDPFNGQDNVDGYSETSTSLPVEHDFDMVITSFVLNVVKESIETEILAEIDSYGVSSVHITRNLDIFETTKGALLRKDKRVSNFFLNEYLTGVEEDYQSIVSDYEAGTLSDEVILDLCHFGVQTSKGFQRIPELERKGLVLSKKTTRSKVYSKVNHVKS